MPVYDCGAPDCLTCKTAFRTKPTPRDEAVLDVIDSAILDSIDIDWTTAGAAEAVYDALRDAGMLRGSDQ